MQTESHWKLAWQARPPEQAHHLNPAFCGALLSRTVREFHDACRTPLNLAVAFLVLPLALHAPTRAQLPRRANVAFAGWVADNDVLLAQLPGRVNRLRPITREALLFAVRHELLAFEKGGLVPGPDPLRLNTKLPSSTDDTNQAHRSARLLGRWFARQNSQSAILRGMGVTP